MTLVGLAFYIIKHKCMYIHTKGKRDSRLKKEKGDQHHSESPH